MAVITTSTFDPLKARCNVRLQQGVPIVDADWNELDDIRKFEMRAYLKWFVGDGIPDGSDAFKIEALGAPTADDFMIRAGSAAMPGGTSHYDQALRFTGRPRRGARTVGWARAASSAAVARRAATCAWA